MDQSGYQYRHIIKRKTNVCTVGSVDIGGGNNIAVQSMTNTLTTDVKATLAQINRCVLLGADIMRVSVPDKESSDALRTICKESPVPIIADIHFHYKRGLEAAAAGAKCLRINPGNIGSKARLLEIIKAAKDNDTSIRIGVNVGSLDTNILAKYNNFPCPEALVESAMDNIKMIEDCDFTNLKISVKASDVMMMVKAYRLLSDKTSYPLHLGLTEAGPAFSGSVKSSMAIGSLLMDGIGDTVRVSLSAEPEEEIKVAWAMLKALELRKRGINIISCPSCARQQFDVIKIVSEIEKQIQTLTCTIDLSILGCVVNGIGEAKRSDIGLTGIPGVDGHSLYLRGKPHKKIKSEDLVSEIVKIINEEFC